MKPSKLVFLRDLQIGISISIAILFTVLVLQTLSLLQTVKPSVTAILTLK